MDRITRAVSGDKRFFAAAAVTGEALKDAAERFSFSPAVSVLFGRAMTAAAMLGVTLKSGGESIALKFEGEHEKMTVVANEKGEVKGTVSEPLWMPKEGESLGSAFGKGTLTVMRDLGLKEAYSGKIDLKSGEIADDVTEYFQKSEQTPFCCSLGVLLDTKSESLAVKSAGGFFVSAMPGCEEELRKRLDENIAVLPPVSAMLESGMDDVDILKAALHGFDPKITERATPKYRCDCSRKKVSAMLLSLGKEDREKIAEDPYTEVVCHWCNARYRFTSDEVKKLYGMK
jgi:molecular chaperone Hsp33